MINSKELRNISINSQLRLMLNFTSSVSWATLTSDLSRRRYVDWMRINVLTICGDWWNRRRITDIGVTGKGGAALLLPVPLDLKYLDFSLPPHACHIQLTAAVEEINNWPMRKRVREGEREEREGREGKEGWREKGRGEKEDGGMNTGGRRMQHCRYHK